MWKVSDNGDWEWKIKNEPGNVRVWEPPRWTIEGE